MWEQLSLYYCERFWMNYGLHIQGRFERSLIDIGLETDREMGTHLYGQRQANPADEDPVNLGQLIISIIHNMHSQKAASNFSYKQYEAIHPFMLLPFSAKYQA